MDDLRVREEEDRLLSLQPSTLEKLLHVISPLAPPISSRHTQHLICSEYACMQTDAPLVYSVI